MLDYANSFLSATYIRCVASGVQSGRYLAPISSAFSLSSPRKGFWNPLRTNTTPSMSRVNGTCCSFWDLAFCLVLGSGLDSLSLFLSAAFWTGDAVEIIRKLKESSPHELIMQRFRDCVTFGRAWAGCTDWTRLVFGGCGFTLRWTRWTFFLRGRRAGSRLSLFAEFKFPFCWWLEVKIQSWNCYFMPEVREHLVPVYIITVVYR